MQSDIYHNKEFYKLQMKWYKKLDDSGFNDIERGGINKLRVYDEYKSILKNPISVLRKKMISWENALSHNSYLQKLHIFSQTRRDLRKILPIYLKITGLTFEKVGIKATPAAQVPENYYDTCNPIYLDNIDRYILDQFSQGTTQTLISHKLKRYYKHLQSTRSAHNSRNFSNSFIRIRLDKLKLLASIFNYVYREED